MALIDIFSLSSTVMIFLVNSPSGHPAFDMPQIKRPQCVSMTSRLLLILGFLTSVSALGDNAGGAACGAYLNNWPQWRGPLANGVAPQANPPIPLERDKQCPLENRSARQGTFFAHCLRRFRLCPCGGAHRHRTKTGL